MTTNPVIQLAFGNALENTKPGTRMAAANVDPDGTARIELLERTDDGWWNLTTERYLTSPAMAARFDDAVVVHLPDEEEQ